MLHHVRIGCWFWPLDRQRAAAARQKGLPYKLVAVEAEPTRFEWITENLRDNGVNLADCRVVHAAVTAADGRVGFQLADPARSYGESIGSGTEVEAISLTTLLGGPFDHVDLVDIDVQGAELDVLENATKSLIEKVKRVHVETHSELLHSLHSGLPAGISVLWATPNPTVRSVFHPRGS
jgi:FkbM family methyltransferase